MDIIIADHVSSAKEIEVHAADCSHIGRLERQGFHTSISYEGVSTRAEVFFDFNDDFYREGGKDACHHLAFKPCTKDLPNGTWPEEFGL